MSNTSIRFIDQGFSVLSVLEIRTARRAQPTAAKLAQLLFDLRVQVVRREEEITNAERVETLWVAEFDGAPVRVNRRLQIQVAVLGALDAIARPVAKVSRNQKNADLYVRDRHAPR